MERFVREWLGPLIDYDARTGPSWSPRCGSTSSAAATTTPPRDALTIHRSTLRYRLRRIRDLTGRDLGAVESRLNLHVRPCLAHPGRIGLRPRRRLHTGVNPSRRSRLVGRRRVPTSGCDGGAEKWGSRPSSRWRRRFPSRSNRSSACRRSTLRSGHGVAAVRDRLGQAADLRHRPDPTMQYHRGLRKRSWPTGCPSPAGERDGHLPGRRAAGPSRCARMIVVRSADSGSARLGWLRQSGQRARPAPAPAPAPAGRDTARGGG